MFRLSDMALHLVLSGYSDRRDHSSDEEEELQEAMRRSLSHDQTTTPTPSAPPLSPDHDAEVQMAIEQSLQHGHPPPPYNPAYNPHDRGTNRTAGTSGNIYEAETVILGEGGVSENVELTRRGRTDTGRGTNTGGATTATMHRTRSNHLDSVRAARLRKFGRMT